MRIEQLHARTHAHISRSRAFRECTRIRGRESGAFGAHSRKGGRKAREESGVERMRKGEKEKRTRSRGRERERERASTSTGWALARAGERLSVGCQRASQSLHAAQAPRLERLSLFLSLSLFRPLCRFRILSFSCSPSPLFLCLSLFLPLRLFFSPSLSASVLLSTVTVALHTRANLAFPSAEGGRERLGSPFASRATSTLQCSGRHCRGEHTDVRRCYIPPPPILHI